MTDAATRERLAQARQRFTQDLAILLTSADFRRFLWHLVDFQDWCKASGLSSADSENRLITDPIPVYFADGRRSIGVELIKAVQRVSPKAYMQMLNEAMGIRNQQPSPPVDVQKK